MKSLKPGESVIVDYPTAAALAAHFRYAGGATVRKAVEGGIQIWVVEEKAEP